HTRSTRDWSSDVCSSDLLKRPEGREVAHRLIRTADIVVEGFRPGAARRMGLDYERVRALKPDIVYCALSGFGQTGPYAQMASHEIGRASWRERGERKRVA